MENIEKLLFIGPPGSGKGTQSKFLVNDYGFQHIITGELLKNSKDPEVLDMIGRGGLVPDEKIFDLIKNNVFGEKSYVLDGSVRTVPQAEFANDRNLVDKVFYFNLSKDECIRRALARGEGREDDNIDSLKIRFDEYREKTEPAINYLKDNFNFYEIDAGRDISEVKSDVYGRLGLK